MGVAVTLAIAGCGGSSATTTSSAHAAKRVAAHKRTPTVVNVTYRPLYSLAAAVQDPAVTLLGGGRFALLGGINASGTSTAGVIIADSEGTVHSATLPAPQHDAQAATLAGLAYVFGGGDLSQYDHILSFDPGSGSVRAVGALPRPASDVAVTQTGGTAYVVGGFDGANWLDTIVAWRPGSSPRVVGHLPVALRYAAVTAEDGKVLILGGSTPSGASDAIYRFDPVSGSVRRIGRLAAPVTHGGAAALGSEVYLVGGRGDSLDARTAAVWAIDPVSGAVHHAGRLPQSLSDAGVISLGDAIIVAGGHAAAGTQAAVGELVPSG